MFNLVMFILIVFGILFGVVVIFKLNNGCLIMLFFLVFIVLLINWIGILIVCFLFILIVKKLMWVIWFLSGLNW